MSRIANYFIWVLLISIFFQENKIISQETTTKNPDVERWLTRLDSPFLRERNEAENRLFDVYPELEEYIDRFPRKEFLNSLSPESFQRLSLIEKRWKYSRIQQAIRSFSGKIVQAELREGRLKSRSNQRADELIAKLKILVDWDGDLDIVRLSFDPASLEIEDGIRSNWRSISAASTQEIGLEPNRASVEILTNIKNGDRSGDPKKRLEQMKQGRLICSANVAVLEKEFRFDNLSFEENDSSLILKKGETTVSVLAVQKNENVVEIKIVVRFENPGDALDSFRNWILTKRIELIVPNENGDSIVLSPREIRQEQRTTNSATLKILFDWSDVRSSGGEINKIAFRCYFPTCVFDERFELTLKNEISKSDSINSL